MEARRGGILSSSSTRLNPRRRAGPDRLAAGSEKDARTGEDHVRVHPRPAGAGSPTGPKVSRASGDGGRVPPSHPHRGRVRDTGREEVRHGRGADPRHGPLPPRDRPDEPPPGGEILGKRQPVRRRQHARDRTGAHAPDRRREARPPAPRNPILVVRRDPLRVPVLRRSPGEAKKISRISIRTWSAPGSRWAGGFST